MALFLLILALVASHSLAQNDCPVHTSGCFCNHDVIDCEDAQLVSVPQFTLVRGKTFSRLTLRDNNITHVPANAFYNLSLDSIDLSQNKISKIDNNSFTNVLNITSLDISHNKLRQLPSDLAKMDRLKSLNILQNPIDLDSLSDHENVLYSLGDTVTAFGFGSDIVTRWPYFLHHMERLEELSFEGRGVKELPINAFNGFQYRLRVLKIRNTNLTQIPLAVGFLENIQEFYYEGNILTGNAGMVVAALTNPINSEFSTKNLKILSLKNNSLTSYPNIIKELPRLEHVILDDNNIEYVDVASVQNTKGPINTISAKNCNLFRIPNHFFSRKTLKNLDLSHNQINSIYRTDFYFHDNLPQEIWPTLQYLSLAYNPLSFVDEHAFDILDHMVSIDLSHIDIPSVPKAIKGADNLERVILKETRVECTCDLRWIKNDASMRNRNITFDGQCETINMALQEYVNTQLSRDRCGD